MSHSKKYQSLWRHGIFDICLAILIIVYPFILLRNFFYAFCYILLLSTLSSFNAICIYKRLNFLFSTSLNTIEDSKCDRMHSRKFEKKEFSVFKSITIVLSTTSMYYILCIFFGAPVFESYRSTLYFSCLMTVLTIYPLLWYFFSSDSFIAIIKLFSDIKCDNFTESHLHAFTVWTIIGAWVGAFPIPLDWDRPWQAWPITCCIGASLGYSAAHFFMGGKLLYSIFKERRKLAGSRSV